MNRKIKTSTLMLAAVMSIAGSVAFAKDIAKDAAGQPAKAKILDP